MVEQSLGIRERTRRAVRTELFTVALGLFLEQGFEETTVEQIAAAAGLSRRSFFRYFASKDDVLAQAMDGAGQGMVAALAARPEIERPWPALRRAFDPLIESMTADPRALALTRLFLAGPAAQAGQHHRKVGWRESLSAALLPRLADKDEDRRRLQAEAISGAALACLFAAQTEWVARDGTRPLADLVDVAMNGVAPTTGPPDPEPAPRVSIRS